MSHLLSSGVMSRLRQSPKRRFEAYALFNIKQFQNRITSEDLFYFGKRQFLFCFPIHSLATVSFGEFCDWPNYLGTVWYELPNKIYCATQCSHALFGCRSWCILDFLNVCLCRFNLSVTNDKSQKFELEITKPGFRGFNFDVSFSQTLK